MSNGWTRITTNAIAVSMSALLHTTAVTAAIPPEQQVTQAQGEKTLQVKIPADRLQQYLAAHEEGRVLEVSLDLQDPAVLQALLQRGKSIAAKAAVLLAKYHASREEWALADTHMAQALQLGPSRIVTLQAAMQYAYARQNYGQAESLLTRAIQLVENQADYDPLQLLKLKDSLADIYMARRQFDKAEEALQKNLEARLALLGQSHPDIADNLNRLGFINATQHQLGEAEQQLSTALGILEPGQPENRDLLEEVKHNLTQVRRTRQRLDQADAGLQ